MFRPAFISFLQISVAIGPLVIFLSGLLVTLFLKVLNRVMGRYVNEQCIMMHSCDYHNYVADGLFHRSCFCLGWSVSLCIAINCAVHSIPIPLCCRVWFQALDPPGSIGENIAVYGSTALVGAGIATVMVTSLSMVADLIDSATVCLG